MDKITVTLMSTGDIGCANIDLKPTRCADLILPTLQQADLRFGQCECTYSERSPAPDVAAAHGYSHLEQASIWQTAGIDVISLASNRTMYEGPEVLLDTISLFKGWGKHVIGAGKDIDAARQPAIVERNGVKIAFLAYSSVTADGGEATKGKVGITPMRAHTFYQRGGDPHEDTQPGTPPIILTVPDEKDLRALQEHIKNAKRLADAVVMSIHWGIHFVPKAIATYQPTVAHAAIDAGADLILGHHPHCLKAVEVYQGKVCFYSLGNFMMIGNTTHLSPSNWHRWNLWWYRFPKDEFMRPDTMYRFPPHMRRTIIAKALFSRKGVEKVSFLPAMINPQAQPALLPASDTRFSDFVEYMEWVSDQYPHQFRVDGEEVIVEPAN